ncbi:MAG: hypothetical protein ACI4E1_12670 [Lachnospira sp.]
MTNGNQFRLMMRERRENRRKDDGHLHTYHNKRVSASATIEGALVIPLFVYVCFTIAFVLWIDGIRTRVNEALCDSVRLFARYGYVSEMVEDKLSDNDVMSLSDKLNEDNASAVGAIISNGLNIAAFQMVFIDRIGKDFSKDNYVVGENAGWIFTGSKIMDGDDCIDIKLQYVIKNPFDIFGIGYITISEEKMSAAWLGESNDSYTAGDNRISQQKFYVAIYGTVYHTDRNCTYLTRIIESCNISDIANHKHMAGGKYYPCKICGENESETVYFTQYGIRYHSNYMCSELQRTFKEVGIEEISGLKACGKCSKERTKGSSGEEDND